jgi:hypothetical protein
MIGMEIWAAKIRIVKLTLQLSEHQMPLITHAQNERLKSIAPHFC